MVGVCPKCGRSYLDAHTIEKGKTYQWTRAQCPCGHDFLVMIDPFGIRELAENSLPKEAER